MTYKEQEIDLIKILISLWIEKWTVFLFVVISLSIGVAYSLNIEKRFESKVSLSILTVPPLYEDINVINDFKENYFSSTVFQEWKLIHSDSKLDFDNISNIKTIDGYELSKSQSESLIEFRLLFNDSDLVGDPLILIKTNDLSILKDTYNYFQFINDVLKKKYILRTKSEIESVKFISTESLGMQDILLLPRFLILIKNSLVIDFNKPSLPVKVFPSNKVILFLSLILGFGFGFGFIIIKNALINYKINKNS